MPTTIAGLLDHCYVLAKHIVITTNKKHEWRSGGYLG